MPSTTNGANKRFELPQLTPVNYSLTDGTDIPPPPDSPIRETPPPPPAVKEQSQVTDPPTPTSTNGETFEPRGRSQHTSHNVPPLSPASTTHTTRPGSIRRFLSRRSLNSGYTNGNKSVDDLSNYSTTSTVVEGGSGASYRPGSSLDNRLKPKRSTSWFRRLGSSSYSDANGSSGVGNRTSVVYEEKVPEKKGPPPPTLPELTIGGRKVNAGDDGGLGAEDMFKNIR